MKGENVVISDMKVSNNNFSTQNMIIYGNYIHEYFIKVMIQYIIIIRTRTYYNKYMNYNEITSQNLIYMEIVNIL